MVLALECSVARRFEGRHNGDGRGASTVGEESDAGVSSTRCSSKKAIGVPLGCSFSAKTRGIDGAVAGLFFSLGAIISASDVCRGGCGEAQFSRRARRKLTGRLGASTNGRGAEETH